MLRAGLDFLVYDTFMSFEEITAPATPPSNQVRLYVKDKSGTSAMYLKDDAGSEREIAPSTAVTGTGTANRLAYWTGAQTIDDLAALTTGHVLFADANGLPTGESNLFWDASNNRLGIGTNAPDDSLHIISSAASSVAILRAVSGGSAFHSGQVVGQRARGSIGSEANAADGDLVLDLVGRPLSGGTYFSTGEISVYVDGTFTNAQRPPSRLEFYTNIANGAQTERLRIHGSGIVEVKTGPLRVADLTASQYVKTDADKDLTSVATLDSADFTGTNWTDLTDGGATTLHTHAGSTAVTEVAAQIFTANGTYTKPADLLFAKVICVGGGGGGGGVDNDAADSAAGGGGGGGYSEEWLMASAIGATETVTVGAGGTASGDENGGAGGNTSFGSLLSANGGGGGGRVISGGGGGTAGAGGTATGGNINISGQAGVIGAVPGGMAQGGAGGDSILGKGGRARISAGNENGPAGSNYGGGGCGGAQINAIAATGGAGAAGIVIVIEYKS